MTGRIARWVLTGAVAMLVVYAWIDGGEEGLRVIRVPMAAAGDTA